MDGRPSIALLLLAAVVAMPCARKGIRTCVPPPPKAAPTQSTAAVAHTGHCPVAEGTARPGVAGHRS